MALKIEERNGRFVVVAPTGKPGEVTTSEYAAKAAAEAHVAIAAKGLSFDQTRQRLQAWAQEQYLAKGDGLGMCAWVQDVFPDRFIYQEPDGKSYERSYALVGGELTVGEAAEVVQTWEAVKSAGDAVVWQGGAVKALGDGKVGGFLITFGDETTPDQSAHRDFFDAGTDYGGDEGAPPPTSPVLYRHGLDDSMKLRRLGRGALKAEDAGVWIEAQLDLRDEYEQGLYAMAKAGKLGWSSGTANHLVAREAVVRAGKTVAHRITHWPLGLDASLTYDPADCRNEAVALKSLSASPPLSELMQEVKEAQVSDGQAANNGPLADHARAVVTACEGYATRLESRCEARVKSGRVLSAANVTELEEVQSALDGVSALQARITTLLEKARPKQADSETEKAEAKAATERLRTQLYRLQHQTRDIEA